MECISVGRVAAQALEAVIARDINVPVVLLEVASFDGVTVKTRTVYTFCSEGKLRVKREILERAEIYIKQMTNSKIYDILKLYDYVQI